MAEVSAPSMRRHRRHLAYLGAAALISVLLAIISLREQDLELAPRYIPETFLPGFAARLDQATDIHVTSRKGTFDVRRTPQGWVLPQRSNYPAALEQVHKTLVGLAALETIEPKTSQPDWYHYLDLDLPPRGGGTVVEISDIKGLQITAVVLGKTVELGDPTGNVGLYVRKASDRQSWLVRSVFEPANDPGDWIDKNVINIDRARIQEVDVAPLGSAAYVIRRDKPDDPDFLPTNMPKGRELLSAGAADGTAVALSGFTFDDVRPAKTLDFSRAAHHVTKTFDGLTVTTLAVQQGADTWASFTASADAAKPDAQKEMHEINARTAGWAFKLASVKAQELAPTLESLLKPLGHPAKTAP